MMRPIVLVDMFADSVMSKHEWIQFWKDVMSDEK